MIKVAVLGSAGRMGRALIRGIAESTSLVLSAAIDKPGLKSIGEDSGLVAGIEANGVLVSDSFSPASADFCISPSLFCQSWDLCITMK